VADLVTHTYDIADAAKAYQLIEQRNEPYLAIRLTYPDRLAGAELPIPIRSQRPARPRQAARPRPSASAPTRSPGVGWIGAGAFSAGILLPAFRAAGFDHLVAVTSASGLSARRLAERHGFQTAVSGASAVIEHADVEIVVIATPHDTHEELVRLALTAGRHVWCEKPLALTTDGVDAVEAGWQASGRQLMVGFNRRWSPAVLAAQRSLTGTPGPRYVVYRVAAGPVPDGHWYRDRRQGGRLLGEVCHFVDTAQDSSAPASRRRSRYSAAAWAAMGLARQAMTRWYRCVSLTARSPPSATAARRRRRERSGLRLWPGRTGW